MTNKPDLEWQKREISAALDGVIEGEKAFRQQHGIDIADEDEWRQVASFMGDIERRLLEKRAAQQSKPNSEDAA